MEGIHSVNSSKNQDWGDKHDEALEHPMSPSGLSSNSTPHLLLKSEMSQILSPPITRLSGSEQA